MNETIAPPRRRWFRFGLRTMFVVVTMFSLWLGWKTKIVRDRQRAIRDFERQGMLVYYADDLFSFNRIPAWRRWVGDKAVHQIRYKLDRTYWASSGRNHPEWERMNALFPEASCVVYGSWRQSVPRKKQIDLEQLSEFERERLEERARMTAGGR